MYCYSLRGTILEKKYEFKTGVSEYIVDISAADLNGNGIEELYVNCYEGRFANSFVLEKTPPVSAELQKTFHGFSGCMNIPERPHPAGPEGRHRQPLSG